MIEKRTGAMTVRFSILVWDGSYLQTLGLTQKA